MATEGTERKVKSIENKIIGEIAFKDFFAICDEYQVAKESTMKLLEIANDPNTKESTRVHIHMWLIDKLVPNPKQTIDMGGDMELKITREILNESAS